MRSIVAVRRGGLGDLLVAAPSIRLLRLACPAARITLVARGSYGCLLGEAGLVDAVEDADDFRWARLSDPAAPPPPALLEADLVIGWFHSKSAADFLNETAGLRPSTIIRRFFADPASGVPLSRRLFDQTAACAADLKCPVFPFDHCSFLPFPEKDPAPSVAGLSRPYAVVHPGGGSRAKRWPGDRFREIIRAAAARGFGGAAVLGEAEEGIRGEWPSSVLPRGWVLLDRPDLFVLAALLSKAAWYFGNDSGVTHLAASLGTPGLAVFRSEFLRAWRPVGRIDTIDASNVWEIPAADVLARSFSLELRCRS